MIRRIITIDEEKCNGCGICEQACHEGAIAIVDGKAKLMREDFCDGLGDCLPACPTGAITFEEREAPAYNEAAVKANMMKKHGRGHGGCPGSMTRSIERKPVKAEPTACDVVSRLANWPVQIKLAPVNAPYFDGARLLIAADCTAFACGAFHDKLMKGRVTLIGCPKLDDTDYSEKLTHILMNNDIKSVTVARMEVPCCSGLANAAIKALQNCGRMIPWQVVTVTIDGNILED